MAVTAFLQRTAWIAFGRRGRPIRAARAAMVALVLLPVGCAGATTAYRDEFGEVYGSYASGRFGQAARRIENEYRDYWELDVDRGAGTVTYGNSAVLWNLERGKILLDAGRFEEGFQALQDAETIIYGGFEERATVSVRDLGSELGSTLSNQKTRPYEGYIYERILLNVYKALCALAAGDLETAAVEARRIDAAQSDALRAFESAVREADESAGSRRLAIDYGALRSDPNVREHYPHFRGADSYPPEYQDFVNPYATLVAGLVRRIRDNPAEDPEVDFRNLVGMLPENEYLRAEWAAIREGYGAEDSVWVLFENGLGPTRGSATIEFPYGFWRQVFGSSKRDLNIFKVAQMALPTLSRGTPAAQALLVRDAGGLEWRTEMVSNMDLVELFEFEQRFSMVLLREALRVIVQETASHEVTKMAREEDEVLGAIVAIGSLLTKSVLNRADDRCWSTIGANFQVARLDMPEARHLELRLLGGRAAPLTVELPDDEVVVLLVRSVNPEHLSCHVAGFSSGRGVQG